MGEGIGLDLGLNRSSLLKYAQWERAQEELGHRVFHSDQKRLHSKERLSRAQAPSALGSRAGSRASQARGGAPQTELSQLEELG